MRSVRTIGTALVVLALAGCQRIGHIQYVLEYSGDPAEMVAAIRTLALSEGMSEKSPAVSIAGHLAYFAVEPEDSSFVDLGVRRVNGELVVDLILRTAGSRAETFDAIQPKIERLLADSSQSGFRIIRDRGSMIPIERQNA